MGFTRPAGKRRSDRRLDARLWAGSQRETWSRPRCRQRTGHRSCSCRAPGTGRASENALCHAWQRALATLAPGLAVRRNYPYRGVADGFTSSLRRRLGATVYAGIELEVSQQHLGRPGARREGLAETILASLEQARARVAGRGRRHR
jgi:hypothetical protein